MAFKFYNPNPKGKLVGDCSVRAISYALNQSWDDTYLGLTAQGLAMGDMPSSNSVWGSYLYDNGFRREVIPNSCPYCYTVIDFCKDNPKGLFVLATGTHVVAVEDGSYFDSWDSGDEVPVYYWRKRS